jgi:hypothetical protein
MTNPGGPQDGAEAMDDWPKGSENVDQACGNSPAPCLGFSVHGCPESNTENDGQNGEHHDEQQNEKQDSGLVRIEESMKIVRVALVNRKHNEISESPYAQERGDCENPAH